MHKIERQEEDRFPGQKSVGGDGERIGPEDGDEIEIEVKTEINSKLG